MEVNVKEILAGFIQHARLSGVGELESNFLEELVAGFDTNSKEARQAMRKLLAHDNHRFFCSACRILKSGVETAGREYLMKLLLEGDLLLVCLANPALFSLETALDLAKLFVRLDPLLDFRLMQLIFRGDRTETGEVDAEQAMRVLELVAALPRHNRILPLLLKLLRFPNPVLRSRAVLLFCQVSKNTQWVEQRLSDENREVRASAVEGLWGVNTPGARAILREAACDLHYRVMANALVGLSLLDGTSAPLEEMVRHPASPFRAAAALSMGRTLDELFVPLLNSMVKDVNAEVRSAVLRSLVAIRRKAA
jgi:HEAT repeat protein